MANSSDHSMRELLQSVHGLSEILSDNLPRNQRHDLHRLLDQQERLAEVRWARLEERVTSHARLIAALGAGLSVLAAGIIALSR